MNMKRRDALRLAGSAILVSALQPAFARAKAQKVLILGGTGFIGPHFVDALSASGHKISLFNRGKREHEEKPGVEQLLGDRDNDLKSLEGRDWDVVIDNSGYTPKQVELSTSLLKEHAKYYIFISSIAAYGDFKNPPIDEDHALAPIGDMPTDKLTGDNYGALKVLCEGVVEKAYGKRANIIRPTYICGPGDHTDRFTYWPFRVSQGGEMIAPGAPDDPIQFIDVRDLADFVRVCTERHVTGKFNLTVPPRFCTIGKLLEESRRVTGTNTKIAWASRDFLLTQKAIDADGWASKEIPIWSPPGGDNPGIALVSSKRAEAKGLKFRSVETTVRDTLAWQKTRPAEKQKLRAGLTPERESELLSKLRES
jgi:2'-hydroxyisoflavone reductase